MSSGTRIGLLGVGRWGLTILRVLVELEHVAAFADVDGAARARAASLCPDAHALASPEALFARDDVDAIVVATPPALHHAHARGALLADKHVLVEKPLATTAADARELVELAGRQGRTLMVGHVCLFDESIRWVKRLIDGGTVGEIRHAFFQRMNGGRVHPSIDAM